VPGSVDLGNFRLGSAPSQSITIGNTDISPAGFQEGLDASVSGTGGRATATGGPIANLAQGGSSSAIGVGINNATATAGLNTGTVTIALASNGSTTSGLPTLSLDPATVNVSGTGFNAAVGSAAPSPIVIANQRVGDAGAQALTVSNTAPAGAFTEVLNASFGANTGAATNNGGAISGGLGTGGVAAGGPANTTALAVGVNTATAGAKSGTVTLDYVSNGAGTSGLAPIAVGSQAITVTGNVYQLAAGQLNTAPLNFGTVQVGQSVSQVLSITNNAVGAAGFVEDLNASFGGSSGTGASLISGSGAISGLLAGATNTTGMTVSVNTSAAGSVNGAIAVNFVSAGAVNGVSNGLGTLGVGSVDYGVQGLIQANVINTASPVINNSLIALGNVRVGATSPTGFVSVTNQAGTPPQAALNASISGNAPVTASGSFNLLDPGATNNSSLQVGMNTAAAGAVNGTATIAFVSDASNVGNCAPNCLLNLASQNVNVTGAVYRLANPTLNTPSVSLAARVGDAAPSAGVSLTNSSPDAFTEGLKASVASTPAGFTGSGAIANLAAQGTDSTTLRVALNTGTAGTFSGNAALALASTGAGTTGAPDEALPGQSVAVTGKVYTPAAASVAPAALDFGIVHVGEAVAAKAVTVANVAPMSALNDVLQGSIAAGGAFNASGTLGAGLAAGASDSTSLTVGLSTALAGIYAGTATVSLVSHNDDMADLALDGALVQLAGQVNNYANPAFVKTGGSGTLGGVGNAFTLDFGTLTLGSGIASSALAVLNDVFGPADLLSGTFDISASDDFLLGGFTDFSGLAAGQLFAGLLASFDAAALGRYTDTVLLHARGSNASGFEELFDLSLVLVADVRQAGAVPEPGTMALVTLALATLAALRRRDRRPIRA
jgi:hypothetical protein